MSNVIEQYLHALNEYEEVSPNDRSLPNPYNFRSLELDPKVTEDDWKKASKPWKERPFAEETDVKQSFLGSKRNTAKAWVIIDGRRRVGIVGSQTFWGFPIKAPQGHGNLVFVTWVRGKKYAARGIMKMLNLPFFDQGPKAYFRIEIYKENKASIATAKLLKASPGRHNGSIVFGLRPPYWWNGDKILKY